MFVKLDDHKKDSRSIELLDTRKRDYGLWIGFYLSGALLLLAIVLWFYKPNQTDQTDEQLNSPTENYLKQREIHSFQIEEIN